MPAEPRITGGQIRAARALLDLSALQLADAAGLSRGTIQRAELETAEITASNAARIAETLEKLGVIFIQPDGDGPGVRLTKKAHARQQRDVRPDR